MSPIVERARPSDELTFAVEVWSLDGQRIDEVMARASHVMVARAAFDAAVRERPGRQVLLRNRAMVLAQSQAEGRR